MIVVNGNRNPPKSEGVGVDILQSIPFVLYRFLEVADVFRLFNFDCENLTGIILENQI